MCSSFVTVPHSGGRKYYRWAFNTTATSLLAAARLGCFFQLIWTTKIYIYIFIWLNQDYFWFRGRSTFRDFNFWLRFLRGKKKTLCHWTFFLEMDFFLRLKSRVSARPHSSPSSDVGACESCLFIHSLWQRGRSTRALVLSKIWVKKTKKKKTHTEPQRLTVTQPCSRVLWSAAHLFLAGWIFDENGEKWNVMVEREKKNIPRVFSSRLIFCPDKNAGMKET